MTDITGLTISQTLTGWRLRLKANNRAEKTIVRYLHAVKTFESWLTTEGLPTEVSAITRSMVEAYQIHLADTGKAPATQAMAHKCLKQYFNYLLDDEEITRHPMAKIKVPHIPETAVPILDDGAVLAMLATCTASDFTDRRDAAMLRLMVDAGTRREETATITLDAVDLDAGVVQVVGKGSNGQARPRLVTIGHGTAAALDKYLRARHGHRWAGKTNRLWLGERGGLGVDGVARMIQKRARLAGLGHVHPHQLRHTWASNLKEANVQPDEIKALAGWRSNAMLDRYGRASVTRRAIASGRKHSTMDRLTRKG